MGQVTAEGDPLAMLRLDDPQQLWRRYGLALCIVLTLLGASHLASTRALSGGEETAATINLAGRQGMLSQRILYFADEVMKSDSDLNVQRLALAVDKFERIHLALVSGGDLGLTAEGAALRADAFAAAPDGRSLDEMSRAFVADARMVLDGPPEARDAAWERMRIFGPTTLLHRLDRAVRVFESQANERTRLARDVARASFALAILVLLIEAALIFWPAQRTVSAAFRRLEDANAALARANAEAQAARSTAEDAMQVRTRFLANMSHELRTPLNGILGMLDLLREAPDPQARDRVATAHGSATDLMRLLDDVLDLTGLESRGISLDVVPLDPERLVRSAMEGAAGPAGAKGVSLRMESGGDGPVARVLGDPARLRQVLVHLLGNAVKFTEAGEVAVRLDHADGRLRVEIRDTGIGIAPEVRERLFEPFVQGDASSTRRFGGSGLGLAICRRVADAMGGTLDVESAPGRGSVFRLEVPAPVAESAPMAEPGAEAIPSGRLRVLVAEDNAVNRKVVTAFLRRLGHEVVCVADGARAVEAVRDAERAFDAVLMDVQMPVMDGLEATRGIRALGPRGALPILALTANGQREEVLRAGMDAHLAKPVQSATLSEALADAVWEARLRDAPGAEVRRASA
jgi:signal transduction histidine kinase/AmiR/NasT family two-component response regulator